MIATIGMIGAAAPAAVVTLDPDDVQSGITTSITILADEGAGVPGPGDNDDAWGFSNDNGQALLGSSSTNTASLANEV